jgi:hypothetical protein
MVLGQGHSLSLRAEEFNLTHRNKIIRSIDSYKFKAEEEGWRN